MIAVIKAKSGLLSQAQQHRAFDDRLHKLLNMAVHADGHEAANALMAIRGHLKREGKTFSDVIVSTGRSSHSRELPPRLLGREVGLKRAERRQ